MDSQTSLDARQLNTIILASPFNAWLGQRVVHVGDDGIQVEVRWREEFVGGAQTRYLHGGIFAALITPAAVTRWPRNSAAPFLSDGAVRSRCCVASWCRAGRDPPLFGSDNKTAGHDPPYTSSGREP
ncbi:MAG: thioesterase superfamily protein [Hydrocarboniphaga sp.]|uniref:PaaI family thioesterase n=1 Tax=Hydrocarboniphaga sp. TaxID=2033016 RepID=UPI002606282C|nr:hypothetical protein [Hydrocarboniphaga sp.]MDB5972446.1 thioesterase superfamily protein [Hydrocarboniphaga sp.]